jgi:hypothetical protein
LYVDYDTEGDLEAIFFILYLQPFQNAARWKFWGGCNTFTISSCSTVGCSKQTQLM